MLRVFRVAYPVAAMAPSQRVPPPSTPPLGRTVRVRALRSVVDRERGEPPPGSGSSCSPSMRSTQELVRGPPRPHPFSRPPSFSPSRPPAAEPTPAPTLSPTYTPSSAPTSTGEPVGAGERGSALAPGAETTDSVETGGSAMGASPGARLGLLSMAACVALGQVL